MTAYIDEATAQRCLAAALQTAAIARGGVMSGTAADLLTLCAGQPGCPSSVGEMQHLGLPELAAKPGFGGITVTRFARDARNPVTMGRQDRWEVRAAPPPRPIVVPVTPCVASAPAIPPQKPLSQSVTALAPAAPRSPRPVLAPAIGGSDTADKPRKAIPVAAVSPVELLRAVPSAARRQAANDAAWAALEQAAQEIFERGAPPVAMVRKVAAVQTVFVRWLNADPGKADEEALSAARQALATDNLNPPPCAA